MDMINKLSSVLLAVGAINWGLYGVFGFDVVHTLFGGIETLPTIVYGLVGLSGIHYVVEGKLFG